MSHSSASHLFREGFLRRIIHELLGCARAPVGFLHVNTLGGSDLEDLGVSWAQGFFLFLFFLPGELSRGGLIQATIGRRKKNDQALIGAASARQLIQVPRSARRGVEWGTSGMAHAIHAHVAYSLGQWACSVTTPGHRQMLEGRPVRGRALFMTHGEPGK